mgnify:CR=1 FL=1
MIKKTDMSNHYDGMRYRSFIFADMHQVDAASGRFCMWLTNQSLSQRRVLVIKAAMKFCALEVLLLSWIRHTADFPRRYQPYTRFRGKPAAMTDEMGICRTCQRQQLGLQQHWWRRQSGSRERKMEEFPCNPVLHVRKCLSRSRKVLKRAE